MGHLRHLLAAVALIAPAAAFAAEVQQAQWASYRDAYRTMVVFEKYGKPKNLIEQRLQVMPKNAGVALDGVQLTLESKSVRLNLPLDALGRAVFPLLKAAYDENGALRLNAEAGQYLLRPRVSISVRADGVYELHELRAACEQVRNYLLYLDRDEAGKRCAGVRIAFDAANPRARLSLPQNTPKTLPVKRGSAFGDDPNARLHVVALRFDGLPEHGTVLTEDVPLVIAPVFE